MDLAYDLDPEFFCLFVSLFCFVFLCFFNLSLRSLRYFQQMQFPVSLCLLVLLSQNPLACQNVGHVLECCLHFLLLPSVKQFYLSKSSSFMSTFFLLTVYHAT